MAESEVNTNTEDRSEQLIALGTLRDYLHEVADGINAIRILMDAYKGDEIDELLTGPIRALLESMDIDRDRGDSCPLDAFQNVADELGGFFYDDYQEAKARKALTEGADAAEGANNG